MAITLGDLRDGVLRLLEAYDNPDVVSEELVLIAIGAAFNALNQFHPKLATTTLAAGVTAYDLPSDCFDVEAVIDADTGYVYPRLLLVPGNRIEQLAEDNAWMLSPTGSITFIEETDNDLTLHYLANWPVPDDTSEDTTVLEPPDCLKTGLMLYATAFCLVPGAQGAGELGQWKSKFDSGNPEHNPLMKVANWLIKWAEIEWSRQPQHQRAQQR